MPDSGWHDVPGTAAVADVDVGQADSAAIVQEDVFGAQIAVNEPLGVQILQRVGKLGGDAHSEVNRQSTTSLQEVAQRRCPRRPR